MNERTEAVITAAQALVDQLMVVHRDEQYRNVWALAQSMNGPYRGPTYAKERQELAAALEALRSDEG